MQELNTVAQDVLALIQCEGISLSNDLSEVERLVRQTVLRVGAKAMELHLAGQRLGVRGEQPGVRPGRVQARPEVRWAPAADAGDADGAGDDQAGVLPLQAMWFVLLPV